MHDDWHVAPAVSTGQLLICSGVLGLTEDGTASQDPSRQYHQAFANRGVLLEEAGVGFGDIVEILSFHVAPPADPRPMTAFGRIKDEYVTGPPYPAWTAIEVSRLGGGALADVYVEMKATALLPG
jgi:enamine deaminase RidA (YjgF/YER057c/UK114 family)